MAHKRAAGTPEITQAPRTTNQKDTNMHLSYEFISAWLTSKVRSERGAALVEYALLVALIAVVCIVAVTAVGTKASAKFNSVQTSL